MIPLWARILGPVVIIAALWAYVDHRAYGRGYAAAVAVQEAEKRAMQAKLDQGAAIILQKSADLERFRNIARTLAMEIDNEIISDPVDNLCVPTDIERLRAKRRWQAAD